VFHLVRPVSRTTIYVSRFASGLVSAALAALVLVGTTLATSGVALPATTVAFVLVAALLGVAAVGTVYYALGAMFRYGTIAGLVYTFVVEMFLAGSRGSMQTLALTYHAKSLVHRVLDPALEGVQRAPRSVAHPRIPRAPDLLETAERIAWEEPSRAVLVLAVVTAVALLVGAWHVSRRDFALKD
jgi:ABC-type transport system involved in multi-copper enzyme maturation permease subunit